MDDFFHYICSGFKDTEDQNGLFGNFSDEFRFDPELKPGIKNKTVTNYLTIQCK